MRFEATSFDSSLDSERTQPNAPPRRIALFTGGYNHIADGCVFTLNRLVAHLEALGTDVLVFAPTVDEPPINHVGTLVPVPSIPVPGRAEYRAPLGMTSKQWRRLERFDPMLVHIATPDRLGYQALRYARRHGLPVVTSYHTHFSSYLKYYHLSVLEPLLWRYLRWFYNSCDRVFAPTESMAELLRGYGIDGDIELWKRGVELSRFDPGHRSMEFRREHGVADDDVLVTWVSRLVIEKGTHVFAEMVEKLNEQGVRHRSMMVGDGPVLDELRERLPDTIFTGHKEHDTLPTAYASSDVFVFPSETETFGNVTLEAMASGLPCVCADATGSASLVQHGVNGYLAEPKNASEFAAHVQTLVEDTELRKRMGEASRRIASEYDWSVILQQMSDHYDHELARVRHAGSDVAAQVVAQPAD